VRDFLFCPQSWRPTATHNFADLPECSIVIPCIVSKHLFCAAVRPAYMRRDFVRHLIVRCSAEEDNPCEGCYTARLCLMSFLQRQVVSGRLSQAFMYLIGWLVSAIRCRRKAKEAEALAHKLAEIKKNN
jgi:hypothetical protein